MSHIIKVNSIQKLKTLVLSGKFDNSIQVKNNEHICQNGSIYDYSEMTDLSHMFEYCSTLRGLPLFDTSNITDMSHMFSFSTLEKFPKGFDTSNVTNMNYMFGHCHDLITIEEIDVSSVESNSEMCFRAYQLEKISIISSVRKQKYTWDMVDKGWGCFLQM
jgi:surface protein